MGEAKDKEQVLTKVEDAGIKFIRLWFTNILGSLKSVAITRGQLKHTIDDGLSKRKGGMIIAHICHNMRSTEPSDSVI